MVSKAEYWEAAYREKRDGWELGEVTPPIARALRDLKVGGRAIVFGCGRGHEARAAARAGFEVVGVDFVEAAAKEAARLTPRELASRITWRVQDLFTLGHEGFDLLIEHTSYCAIDPSRRDEWMRVARAVLRPGGTLLGLFYTHAREGGPPYGATRESVLDALAGAGFRVESQETPSDSIERRRGDELLVRAVAI